MEATSSLSARFDAKSAAAERYPRVVCALHAGIIGGALAELGAPVELERLEPWVTPTSCVAWLRPSDGALALERQR
jgi:hypothetical protein